MQNHLEAIERVRNQEIASELLSKVKDTVSLIDKLIVATDEERAEESDELREYYITRMHAIKNGLVNILPLVYSQNNFSALEEKLKAMRLRLQG